MAESTLLAFQEEKNKAYMAAQTARRLNNIEFFFLMLTATVLCFGLIFIRANSTVPAVSAGVLFGYGILKGIVSLFRNSAEAQADKALTANTSAQNAELGKLLKIAQEQKAHKSSHYSMNTSLFEGDDSTPFANAKYTHHRVQSQLYRRARQGLTENNTEFAETLVSERIAREKTKLELLKVFKKALDSKQLGFSVRFLQTPESSHIRIDNSFDGKAKRDQFIAELIRINQTNPLIEQKPGVPDRVFCEETLLPLVVNVSKIFPDYRHNLDHVKHYGYLGSITAKVCGRLIDERIAKLEAKVDPERTQDSLNRLHFSR